MKKIVVLSNTAFSIEKFRLHYLKNILNYKMDIFTPYSKVNISPNIKNIKSFQLSNENILSQFLSINKIINENINATFIIFSFKYQFMIGLIRLIKPFKVIILIAGKGLLFYKRTILNTIFKPFIKFIFNKFNIIICINPDDREFFSAYFNNEVELIPTEGLFLPKIIKENNNNKKNFIFFSRIIKEKGINEFLDIAKYYKEKNKNFNFYVCGPLNNKNFVGQSGFFSRIYYKIKLKKYKKYITYLGHEKDYKKIFSKMDCLVSPSYSEGAGTSVMEAMISGLFVIAYKNNGHNFVLNNTGNILCDQNVSALKKGIEKFLKIDKNKLSQISSKSKIKVYKNFKSEIITKKLNDIINKKPKVAFVNFYQTTSSDAAYPRNILIKNNLKDMCDIDIYGCINNHFILSKKKDFDVNWIKSVNYNNLLGRVISIILFCTKLIFFEKRIKKYDYIVFSDLKTSFLFSIFSFLFKYKTIIEIRDIYPETLIYAYNYKRYSFTVLIYKFLEKILMKNNRYYFSSLSNFDKKLSKLNLNTKFLYIPNYFDKVKFLKNNKKYNFCYIGSMNLSTNFDKILNCVLKLQENNIKFRLYIVSKGEIFFKYKNKLSDNKNIIFKKMNNKNNILKIVKKSNFGFIAYKNLKQLYKYGISPRKFNFYIDNGLIPLFIGEKQSCLKFTDKLFYIKSPKSFIKMIYKINMTNEDLVKNKINRIIKKYVRLNKSLPTRFKNFIA